MRLLPAFFASLLVLLVPAHADPSIDAGFRSFLQTEIWPEAEARGVSRTVFDRAFQGVAPNLELPDLQLPGASETVEQINFQAEFKNGSDYLSKRALGTTVRTGRELLARHAALLERIEERYGVPAPIIIAIWGRESAFGNAAIPHNAFEVLGTKAWLSRRKQMFRTELLAALEIAENGDRPVNVMRSSWAGALGQPQFMPSKFLQYAVDFDGDGKRDIWNSVPDTLASIANYLKEHGWQTGRDWGFEAEIPMSVSCTTEGPDQGRPISTFVTDGVSRVSGRPFPDREIGETGHVMMPAGRMGPMFLATPNFYVLKAYNNSDLYALFVGHAADRMLGSGTFSTGWKEPDSLTRGDVAKLQSKLVALGHDVGGVDGLAGFKTRRSIGKVEREFGLAETCWPSRRLVEALD
ncbi:probable transglycolase [Fulvimarina pelagi HTCC2506]|uniref:Probable transglycolase n=2 Tax=Fulvimarina pelagi TaxID=217511 RepID=Q0G181_9HYPH|nr:lytic murein transglycosylase [Fulvimarina pelagi]EAU41200.1 probable transglycolase [Fulvimarina pelagi HTCC2506]BAT30789.1 probable transglycosylase [Fulvimarina pelagi]